MLYSTGAANNDDARIAPILEWLQDYAARRLNSRLIDERRAIPPYVVLDLGNRGLLGMQVPKADGGVLELSHYEMLRVQRQLGAIDLTLAFFVGLNNGLGIRPILRFASPSTKSRYLPDLATGRILGAFAITEAGAGSNPLAIAATATRCSEGFRLSGEKLWCGSASWAGVISVFARHFDGQGRPLGHVGLCVDANQAGLRFGEEALTMGLRGMVQNRVYFNDALVSSDAVLGSEFAGLSVASDVMLFGRLGIAATAVGGLWRALQLMVRYSSRRQVGTGRLYDNDHAQGIMRATWFAAKALGQLVDRMAMALDCGEALPTELYAAAKLLAGEALWQGADSAVQLLGGRGYCENNLATQLLRDARITRLFEGPSETLAAYIGQRLWQAGPSNSCIDYLDKHATGKQLRKLLSCLQERHGARRLTENPMHSVTIALGFAAAWLLVAAHNDCSDLHVRQWIEQQYNLAVSKALSVDVSEALPGSEVLAANVAHAIGDIEQGLAGEDLALDGYLRR